MSEQPNQYEPRLRAVPAPDTLGTITLSTEVIHRLPEDQLEWMAQRVAELTQPADEILNSEQAAAFLRCSVAQLSRLTNGGGLPVIKLDSYNRYFKSDLVTYAARLRQIEAA